MTSNSDLTPLRNELASMDEELLELVAARLKVAFELGRLKALAGLPTRDYGQEKDVIDRARARATELGLFPELAEELMVQLIRSSLTVQEQDRIQASAGGTGQKVLVIGGAGKMGRWLVRFLSSQGYTVEVADPSGPVEGYAHVPSWQVTPVDHDMIVVAAPLRTSNEILQHLASRKPKGIVFDVGSLKTPLRKGLLALVEAGCKVTSIHPMFGPDTVLLSGRNVIFVDVGVPEATREARKLFDSTMAVQVEMDLDSHDRVIAYVLGLSHTLNIAFFTALAESGEDAERLAGLSSTTFDAQLQVATRVAEENPHLYFEIQSLNEYGADALNALEKAVERVRSVVSSGDEAGFAALMRKGRDYLLKR